MSYNCMSTFSNGPKEASEVAAEEDAAEALGVLRAAALPALRDAGLLDPRHGHRLRAHPRGEGHGPRQLLRAELRARAALRRASP